MGLETKDLVGILGTVVLSIVTFLIGKSGVVRRYFDNRLKRVERQQQKEEEDVIKTKEENEKLHELVDELNSKVAHLEQELAITNIKLQTLLAYFEKIAPEGDTFIEKLKSNIGRGESSLSIRFGCMGEVFMLLSTS